jgi:hypothetical protein
MGRSFRGADHLEPGSPLEHRDGDRRDFAHQRVGCEVELG